MYLQIPCSNASKRVGLKNHTLTTFLKRRWGREEDGVTVEDFIAFDDNPTTLTGQMNTKMIE